MIEVCGRYWRVSKVLTWMRLTLQSSGSSYAALLQRVLGAKCRGSMQGMLTDKSQARSTLQSTVAQSAPLEDKTGTGKN